MTRRHAMQHHFATASASSCQCGSSCADHASSAVLGIAAAVSIFIISILSILGWLALAGIVVRLCGILVLVLLCVSSLLCGPRDSVAAA